MTTSTTANPTAVPNVASPRRRLAAIILAAGKGTRMNSDLPKVAHPVGDRAMVEWVVDACRQVGASPIVLVVGHRADIVREIFTGNDNDLRFALQSEQLGTGHAVQSARAELDPAEMKDTDVLVLCGDGPLIRPQTLRALVDAHRRTGATATLATANITDPTGYGRIVRDATGTFERIVEHHEASTDEQSIREVNPSYYCFEGSALFDALDRINNRNTKGEYYITDVFDILRQDGKRIEVVDAVPADDVLSINTPDQLAKVDAILRQRQEVLHMSASDRDYLKIFGGRAGRALAEAMCDHLSIPVGNGHMELFPDGEMIVKVNEDVRGRDCFVVQSTCDPVNANLMELLIWIDCLRRASAKRITAVIPYFGYARQDRKDEGRTPITAKLVANLIVAAGADRVVCMDLHAAQIQGFFDIPVDHLSASRVLGDHFMTMRARLNDPVIVSPDIGNVKVANMYAGMLNADLAIIDKRRESGDTVASRNLIGDVEGRTVLMVDDMISTAGTICEAARFVMDHGAKEVFAASTHAVLVGLAMERLRNAPIAEVIVTDTIPNGERTAPLADKLKVLSIAKLLGEAVHRIHHNMSISALFRSGAGTKR